MTCGSADQGPPLVKVPHLEAENEVYCESDLSFLESTSASCSSSRSSLSSFSSASVNRHPEVDELSQPMYTGASITVLQSCIIMMQYKFRHSLSKKAFSELVELVALHLPQDLQLTRSIRAIRKQMNELFQDVAAKKHYYCGCCSKMLTSVAIPSVLEQVDAAFYMCHLCHS